MRIIKTLILLSVFAGVTLLGNLLYTNNADLNNRKIAEAKPQANLQLNEKVRTHYKIDVEYQKTSNTLIVNETIKWKNIDSIKVDSLFMNIPTSSKGGSYKHSKLTYLISSLKINGEEVAYEFLPNNERGFIDSSLISVRIPNGVKGNETIEIITKFSIVLSDESKWSDAKFYNFENWYVTVSPFIDGEFISFPTHNYIAAFLEYSNFDVTIKTPEEYSVALSGEWTSKNSSGINLYTISAKNISRFNWFLFNELNKYSKRVNINSKEIILDIFIQDGKDDYTERYVDGVEKYLQSLSSFGSYPFKRFTIVDIPNYGNVKNKSYPNLIALNTDFISPVKTQKIEYQLALVIAEQYFGTLINSNSIKEAWLSKGLSSFVAEKLVRAHYGNLYAYFNVADYYPIYGLHFMSFAGIPLIYIVSDQVIPEGGRYLKEYYTNLTYTDLSTPSYILPNYEVYNAATVVKPQIALLTLEKIMGEEKFRNKLQKYFKMFSSKYASANDFGKIIMNNCSQANREIYNELFKSDKTFDYGIKSIEKGDGNEYEILVERIENGVMPIVISVITETDTIKLNWNGKERFKVFSINTDAEVISAELDSDNKNLLDLNFANNSYIVDEQYWGSVSYATRVFFWFQNALMLIGGKG
ncbi:MAG: hypothetical protein L3J41_07015 [Melioribacteraceae bacterium]|nr:hypothetical protein [Melioribacteraceae bacterium]